MSCVGELWALWNNESLFQKLFCNSLHSYFARRWRCCCSCSCCHKQTCSRWIRPGYQGSFTLITPLSRRPSGYPAGALVSATPFTAATWRPRVSRNRFMIRKLLPSSATRKNFKSLKYVCGVPDDFYGWGMELLSSRRWRLHWPKW